MVNVAVEYNAADPCVEGAVTCTLIVTSNEPINGTGDGDTSPDWVVLDPHRVHLRSERAGTGRGRTYTIHVTCTNAAGYSSTKTVAVLVPKSQSKK